MEIELPSVKKLRLRGFKHPDLYPNLIRSLQKATKGQMIELDILHCFAFAF
jgi:hypothetical protein